MSCFYSIFAFVFIFVLFSSLLSFTRLYPFFLFIYNLSKFSSENFSSLNSNIYIYLYCYFYLFWKLLRNSPLYFTLSGETQLNVFLLIFLELLTIFQNFPKLLQAFLCFSSISFFISFFSVFLTNSRNFIRNILAARFSPQFSIHFIMKQNSVVAVDSVFFSCCYN